MGYLGPLIVRLIFKVIIKGMSLKIKGIPLIPPLFVYLISLLASLIYLIAPFIYIHLNVKANQSFKVFQGFRP